MRKPQDQQLIGESPAFLEVLEHVSRVAPLNRPVLVIGERGEAFHMPTLLNERLPFEYPSDAWRDRIGGETVLRIRISSTGIVDSMTVERSSGHRGLDSAAVAGATELRYKPARQGERPVPVWATLPIQYPMPERSDQP